MRDAVRFLSAVAVAFLIVPATFAASNPEVDMNVPEMIRYHGYPVEIISVTTEDGYVLEMHRIPFGRAGRGPGNISRPVMFLQHGLEADSSNWVINMPEQSAGFIYADAGYDVWLGNMRGNTYGKAHTTLDPRSEQFWEFSWDEMTQKDLDAMINKALEKSGQDSLYYVAHSQGTLTMFSKLSYDQEFAKKIKAVFALAPIGTVKYIQGLIKVASQLFSSELGLWYRVFGSGEFLPSNWVLHLVAEYVCGYNLEKGLCDDFMWLIAGPETAQFNQSRTEVYIAHTPAGTSTQNVMHWAQMVKEDTVARYDYGSSKPPSYDFENIKAPVYLFWSPEDWLADEQDINEYLLHSINPKYLKRNTKLAGYNHFDFIWGLRAADEIYRPIHYIISDLQRAE